MYKVMFNAKLILPVIAILSMVTLVSGQNETYSPANVITNEVCSIYNIIHTVIFVIALALMVLGGAIYAVSHATGGMKGTLQGYAMGLIL